MCMYYVELRWYFCCVSQYVSRAVPISKAAKIAIANNLFHQLKAFRQRFRYNI